MEEHNEIYLQPICPTCDSEALGEDRLWCQDDVWKGDSCEGCGDELPPTSKYILKP